MVTLLGARQVGKTTLARRLANAYRHPVAWFDLEDPVDLARLEDPGLELRPLRGLVILDEIHRLPGIFRLLRVLADRPGPPARFLVLGSASTDLLRQTSESLAGRVAFHELDGFDLTEVDDPQRLWLRGGFPRSYRARSGAASRRWRDGFVRTLLARDLPGFGSTIPSTTLRRFWTMLAHCHGQVWNGAEFGRAFGVAHTTVRRYLDLLTSVLVVRQLQPWFENIGKRQVRSPKVYIADSGILHALLGLTDRTDVLSHPKVGASWEGFAIQQVVQLLRAPPEQCFHWVHAHGRRTRPSRARGGAAPRFQGEALGGAASDPLHAFGAGDAQPRPPRRDPCGNGALQAGPARACACAPRPSWRTRYGPSTGGGPKDSGERRRVDGPPRHIGRPTVAGTRRSPHNPLQILVEQRHREGGVTVRRAVDHPLLHQSRPRGGHTLDGPSQNLRDRPRTNGPGSQLGHGAQIFPFERSRTFEANAEEGRVEFADGNGCRRQQLDGGPGHQPAQLSRHPGP